MPDTPHKPYAWSRVGGPDGETYRWESFDVPRVEFVKADGTKGIHWEDDECWCTFVDDMTGKRIRMRLQDEDWQKDLGGNSAC